MIAAAAEEGRTGGAEAALRCAAAEKEAASARLREGRVRLALLKYRQAPWGTTCLSTTYITSSNIVNNAAKYDGP